jgi:hypothetical protein
MEETSTPINRGVSAKIDNETNTEELIYLGSDEVLINTDLSATAVHFLDNLPIYQRPENRDKTSP